METMSNNNPQTSLFLIPNKFGRVLIQSFEEIVGQAAMNAVQKSAGLDNFIGVLPPNNVEHAFHLNHLSQIQEALEFTYGPRAGRGFALRAGRISLKLGLREFGPILGVTDLSFRLLPLRIKVQKGIQTLADLFNHYSQESIHVAEGEDHFEWVVHQCPLCWQRNTDAPCCHLAVGMLQELLSWISGGKNFLVEEKTCIAAGDPNCTIQIAKHCLD
jgi:predicted hydrocarbon binding protein